MKQLRQDDENIFSIYERRTREEVDKLYESQLRGALKGVNVRFKKENLSRIAINSEHFSRIRSLLAALIRREMSAREALYFVNECLMIGVACEFSRLDENDCGDECLEFVESISDSIVKLLFQLVYEVEAYFISDMIDKTHYLAMNIYISVQNAKVVDDQLGNLPLETAMQTS